MKYVALTLSEKQIRILMGTIDIYKSIYKERNYPIDETYVEIEDLKKYLFHRLYEQEDA